jgi:hypothetical protein
MIDFYFWSLVVLVSIPLLTALTKPQRIYQYPYFMAAVFGIFILPQAVSLVRFPGATPELAISTVFLVSCLCLVACFVGYSLPELPRNHFRQSRRVNEARLFHAGLVFVVCGLWFSYLLRHTEVQTTELGGWTGPATIYGFFQQLCYPGFAICLMSAIRKPSSLRIGAALVGSIVPVQSIFFGRREPAALFALTVGLTLYFQLRVRPTRWLLMVAIVAAMLAIPATAMYRRLQLDNDWAGVRQIDLLENFGRFLNEESVLELRNAAMLIEATRRSGDYQYGAGYWNHLIFRYVPAQLLSNRFKDSLMVRPSAEGVERELSGMDYVNPIGSTVTGIGDSFQQFGYGGCLFFAAMASLFRRLWHSAVRPDALFAQLLYMQSCTCAMRAVTHWTLDFLPGLLYNAIFLGAAAIYATAKNEGRTLSLAKSQVKGKPHFVGGLPGELPSSESFGRSPSPHSSLTPPLHGRRRFTCREPWQR